MSTQNIEDIYPLSPMQQGMLFHTILTPDSGEYFEQGVWKLTGALDISAFKRAWKAVVNRHAALRAAFLWEGLDQPVQVIYRTVELPIEFQDWTDIGSDQLNQVLEDFLIKDRKDGFVLNNPPLMRIILLKTAADQWIFVWSHHHTLLDGWSQPILLTEFLTLYQGYRSGKEVRLPMPSSYRDYIAWLKKQDLAQAESTWREELAGIHMPTVISPNSDVSRSQIGNSESTYTTQRFAFSEKLSNDLVNFVRTHQITLSTLLQCGVGLLLSRYSREEDVIFGSTVSGRPAELAGSESIVGLLINTLPIHIRVSREKQVLSWLQDLQARQVKLRQYEYCSLIDIQGWSEIPRGQPLFETLLVFENYPVDPHGMSLAGDLKIENISSYAHTNYPLTIVVSPGNSIGLEIAYDTTRFYKDSIQRMAGHLQTLLDGMIREPQGSISSLPMLTAAEEELLSSWNRTNIEYPADQCVHQLFEERAARYPKSTAVRSGEQTLISAELNSRANQLAHHLLEMGLKRNQLVGLAVDRSFDMIIGLLGILKAGGAYLPLDPYYPADRLAYMLADSRANILITQARLASRIPAGTARIVLIDQDWSEISHQPEENPGLAITPKSPAYVIYTSGSTGKPKGVLAHHRGLVNFSTAFIHDLDLGPESRVLQFSSFSFDASAGEIFAGLLSGGQLILAGSDTLFSLDSLSSLIQQAGVNVATLPPSLLEVLDPSEVPGLSTVVSVGDVCTPRVADRWCEGRRFFNGYGPTETTIGACWGQIIKTTDNLLRTVPIGRTISNMRIYLVDPDMHRVPVGVPGEILIGGPGVTHGYLNLPELTSERFIPDPFQKQNGGNLYRTGDLARYLPDGRLEFLGRLDNQVKIRGFRIELGEIEAALCRHPAVRQAVVLAREDRPGEKVLTGYIIPQDVAHPPLTSELQAFLKAHLPTYMIPAVWIFLEDLPMLASGKVDRKALPVPEFSEEPFGVRQQPRTPIEQGLAEIWQQVLNVKRVSLNENFFELGGHSLLAAQMVARVRETFQVELPLKDLFDAPILTDLASRLASRLREKISSPYLPILPKPHDQAPLSFPQQRLWFIEQLAPGNLFYNVPLIVRLSGPMDLTAFQRSLNEIVRRHEVLRTRFQMQAGQPYQEIQPSISIPIDMVDLMEMPREKLDDQIQRLAIQEISKPFDLATGPLFRVRLLRSSSEEHVVVMVMHHIITDGWSMGILLREFTLLYSAYLTGQDSHLPDLTIQYADYALWQRELIKGEFLEQQLSYWKDQLIGMPPALELPTDRPRPTVKSSNGETLVFNLSSSMTRRIKEVCKEEGTTLFMVLLAAFQVLLARYSGKEDIPIGTVVANRNWQEVEGLIGFFVNTLVIRTNLEGSPVFREVLKRVRDIVLGAYAHQDLPFETLVEALQPRRDLSMTPLFQVMFVLDPPMVETGEITGFKVSPLNVQSGVSTFDMTLSMTSASERISGSLEYNTDLWDRRTIERLIVHFQNLLNSALNNQDQSIWELPYLSTTEKQTLLFDWNQTETPAPLNVCAHQLFESRASQQPGAQALIFQDTKLTYGELNERANQLAHFLQEIGVGRGTLVGISTSRSVESIIGILGVMKAGGVYLPLDPSYPRDRLAFMISDSKVEVLLTLESVVGHLPEFRGRQICLDADWPQIANYSTENMDATVTAEDLAYIIYTSGSTGKPKGALLRHRGLCNLAEAQRKAFDIQESSRVLQFSPFSFDASVWEIFMALANGGTLVQAPQDVLASSLDLLNLLKVNCISHVTLPPSVLQVLPEADLPDLKVIVAAGEACPAELVARWAPGRRFFNAYGPTETTVCASMYCTNESEQGLPPIGRPIANTHLYIADSHLQLLPVGIPGELLVGGVSLAQGYLNRPELTAEKFVPNPFGDHKGDLLYRTGDLVRYRYDGQVEFIGRIDQQVKVRGFRIELGEIESTLLSHPAIRQAAVIVRSDLGNDLRLVAYLVCEEGRVLTQADLRSFLRETLPEYMLPSAFVFLDSLPLSPSGKIDRRAFPAPEASRLDREREYTPPRSPLEKRLAEICAELLALDRVGISDNFFDLGGHSLLATQFVSRIREEYSVEVPLRTLFEHPTVTELAQEIEHLQESHENLPAPVIPRVSREEHRVQRKREETSHVKGSEL